MPAPITRKSQEFAKGNFNKQLRGFALARCELAPFAELFEKSFVQGGKDGADMQTVFLTMLMMTGDWDVLVRQGTDAYHAGRKAEALQMYEECWKLAATPVQKAITANDIAAALHALQRDKEARPWYERGLELWKMVPGHSEDQAETGLSLSDIYRAEGDFGAAEKLMGELLRTEVSNEGRATILNSMGDMLREQARKDEARQYFEAARAVPGTTDKRQIEALLGLGDIDRGGGRFNAAHEKWKKAGELARANGLGRYEALALRGAGLTFVNSGEYARAEGPLRQSLKMFEGRMFEKDAEQDWRQLASAWSCLAECYYQQGKLAKAEEGYRQALVMQRKASGDRHPQTAMILEALAGVYAYQKRFGEAYALANEARSVMVEKFGESSIPAAGALATVALVEQREKKWERAAADYESALKVLRAEGGRGDQAIQDVVSRYGQVMGAMKRKAPVDTSFR